MKLLLLVLLVVVNNSCAMDCAICLDQLTQAAYLELGCSHAYHGECWEEWEFNENTRITLFLSLRNENDDQNSNEQEIEIPGIRCPSCSEVVTTRVYHAAQESGHEPNYDEEEIVAANPVSLVKSQSSDEPNPSFWDIFSPDPDDQPAQPAHNDDDNQL